MLTRRALIGSTAVLATGCGFLESRFSPPSLPEETPLTWAVSRVFQEEMPWLAEQRLMVDKENSNGPKLGGYSLARRNVEGYPDLGELVKILREMEADLVNVDTFNVQGLVEKGVLLPLDDFSGAEETSLNQEFYPSTLEQFRIDETLYALPINARPLMMHYDATLFAAEGVPPMDSSWDWEDLVRTAELLVRRDEDGVIKRWGLAAHNYGIWWALWQNKAEVVDPTSGECRLRDSAAIEALNLVRELFHTQRVSPAALGRNLWDNLHINGLPPAMMHSQHAKTYRRDYRLAELPRGRVQVVPVEAEMAMAIVADTPKPEVAYLALRGLVDVMQELVNIPAKREVIARLGELKKDLQEDEIVTIQQSMEHGRGMPRHSRARRAMDKALEALVRGDDIIAAVNEACSLVR